jgi:hypothetical protein
MLVLMTTRCETAYRAEAVNLEELPMTLQVGLVGNGAIVLASDQCRITVQNGVRLTSRVSKFVPGRRSILAFAGDDWAERVARMACAAIDDAGSTKTPPEILMDVVNPLLPQIKNNGSVVGITDGDLWAANFGFAAGYYSSAYAIDKIIAGDNTNAAGYFTEKYYSGLKNSTLALKRLAAHVICMGGKLNPSGVQGLEMFIWDKQSRTFVPIDQREIDALAVWSGTIDKIIADKFSD